MKIFEICAEVVVPKFTRAEVRLPVVKSLQDFSQVKNVFIFKRSRFEKSFDYFYFEFFTTSRDLFLILNSFEVSKFFTK